MEKTFLERGRLSSTWSVAVRVTAGQKSISGLLGYIFMAKGGVDSLLAPLRFPLSGWKEKNPPSAEF